MVHSFNYGKFKVYSTVSLLSRGCSTPSIRQRTSQHGTPCSTSTALTLSVVGVSSATVGVNTENLAGWTNFTVGGKSRLALAARRAKRTGLLAFNHRTTLGSAVAPPD